jgi:hypothetical protein
MMDGKRSNIMRTFAETARRGRPRRATRSTYATKRQEDSKDEQPVQDQLLSLQQEWDRVAAASQ